MGRQDPQYLFWTALVFFLLPVCMSALWISIAAEENLPYYEKVALFLSFFPEVMQNTWTITAASTASGFIAVILSCISLLKAEQYKLVWANSVLLALSLLLCGWLLFSMM